MFVLIPPPRTHRWLSSVYCYVPTHALWCICKVCLDEMLYTIDNTVPCVAVMYLLWQEEWNQIKICTILILSLKAPFEWAITDLIQQGIHKSTESEQSEHGCHSLTSNAVQFCLAVQHMSNCRSKLTRMGSMWYPLSAYYKLPPIQRTINIPRPEQIQS